MSDIDEKLSALKKLLRSYLLSAPHGLTTQQLAVEFRQQEGRPIPFHEFGFPSLAAFLESCGDTVELKYEFGVQTLKAVADSSTVHIERLVARQNKKPLKFKTKDKNPLPIWYNERLPLNTKLCNNKKTLIVPAGMQNKIFSLLQNYRQGIRIDNFSTAWSKKYGNTLDFRVHGFDSMAQMFEVLSDSVLCKLQNGALHIQLKSHLLTKNLNHDEEIRGDCSSRVSKTKFEAKRNSSNRESNECLQVNVEEDLGNLNPKMKKEFVEILKRHPKGISAYKFCDEYQLSTRNQLRFGELGYFSVIDMAASHPSIFDIHQSPNPEKDWILTSKGAKVDLAPHSDKKNSDGLLKQKINKVIAYRPRGISLAMFPKFFEKVNEEPLEKYLQGCDNLEKFIRENFSDMLQLDHQNGTVMVVSKSNTSIPAAMAVVPPSDIAASEEGYTKVKLPSEDQVEDGYLEILVGEVKTPGIFWFFLNGPSYSDALQTLMDNLELVYDGQEGYSYIMPHCAFMIGLACVGRYPEDKNWHRCLITGIRDLENLEVNYVDYGTTGMLPRSEIRYIKKEFMEFPSQAITGTLADIQPVSGDTWSKESGQFLLDLVKEKVILAKVKQKSALIASLELYDTTSSDQDVFINDEMVLHGYAKSTIQSLPSANPVQNALLTSLPLANNLLLNADLARVMQNSNSLTTALALQLLQQPMLGNIPAVDPLLQALTILSQTTLPPASSSMSHTVPNNKASTEVNVPNMNAEEYDKPTVNASTEVNVPNMNTEEYGKSTTKYSKQMNEPEHHDTDEKLARYSKKRFIKRVNLRDDITIHIISFEDEPYMTSGEISSFFWQRDNLRRMLRVMNSKFPCVILDQQEHPVLFRYMAMFDIPGLRENDTGSLKEMIFIYPLKSVPQILVELKYKSSYLKEDLLQQVDDFDPNSPYWMGEEHCETDEKCTPANSSFEELNSALQSLLLERKQLMTNMMNDENFKGCDLLKQIEDQLDSVKSKMSKYEDSNHDYSNNRSTPDGADESRITGVRAVKSNFNVNAPEFICVQPKGNYLADIDAVQQPNLLMSTHQSHHKLFVPTVSQCNNVTLQQQMSPVYPAYVPDVPSASWSRHD